MIASNLSLVPSHFNGKQKEWGTFSLPLVVTVIVTVYMPITTSQSLLNVYRWLNEKVGYKRGVPRVKNVHFLMEAVVEVVQFRGVFTMVLLVLKHPPKI